MLNELDKRVFLNKQELEETRKKLQEDDPKKKGSSMYKFEDERNEEKIIEEQMYAMAQSMKEMAYNMQSQF